MWISCKLTYSLFFTLTFSERRSLCLGELLRSHCSPYFNSCYASHLSLRTESSSPPKKERTGSGSPLRVLSELSSKISVRHITFTQSVTSYPFFFYANKSRQSLPPRPPIPSTPPTPVAEPLMRLGRLPYSFSPV